MDQCTVVIDRIDYNIEHTQAKVHVVWTDGLVHLQN